MRSTLSREDALDLGYLCRDIAGLWPLEMLDVESVIDLAREMWADHPAEIERLTWTACLRVSSKWSSDGNLTGAAEDWALDLIRQYAAEEGLQLVEADPL